MARRRRRKNSVGIIIGVIAGIIVIVALVTVIVMLLAGNSKKKYYQNTRIKNLKTFTTFSDVEPVTVEQSGATTVYLYYLEPGASTSTAILKYEQYLTGEMGFVAEPNGMMTAYVKGDDLVMEWVDESSGTMIEYYICIPLDMTNEEIDNVIESGSDETANLGSVEEMRKLNASGNVEKAYEMWENNVWSDADEKDAREEMLYAKAVIWYKNGLYGEALDFLIKHGAGKYDSDKIMSDIHSKVDKYTGTYYYDCNNHATLGKYLFIQDGMVAFGFDSDAAKSEIYYQDGCIAEKDGLLVIGSSNDLDLEVEYAVAEMTSSFSFQSVSGSDTWDGGPYKKQSSTAPKVKR